MNESLLTTATPIRPSVRIHPGIYSCSPTNVRTDVTESRTP